MGVPPPGMTRAAIITSIEIVAGIGAGLFHAGKQARDLLDFFGAVVIGFFRQFVQPRRIRVISLIAQIEQTGLNAMPIIGLISFLIGVVLAYQGYDQLRPSAGRSSPSIWSASRSCARWASC